MPKAPRKVETNRRTVSRRSGKAAPPRGIFDVAFHVSGINFFNDKARAIAEMICVARAILGQSAEAIYGYTDAFGKELSQVVRYSPIRKHVV